MPKKKDTKHLRIRPRSMRYSKTRRTACGVDDAKVWKNEGTFDPEQVSCGSCKRTKAFKELSGS
jgi:hypothetical protein